MTTARADMQDRLVRRLRTIAVSRMVLPRLAAALAAVQFRHGTGALETHTTAGARRLSALADYGAALSFTLDDDPVLELLAELLADGADLDTEITDALGYVRDSHGERGMGLDHPQFAQGACCAPWPTASEVDDGHTPFPAGEPRNSERNDHA